MFLDGAREWGEREHVVGAEFDRWLRSVKAAVWDEGFDFGHYAADWESRDCDCRKNPYREDS